MNRERDTDVEIIAEMRQHISEHDALSRDGKRIWSLSRYTSPSMFEEFTVAAARELDRLQADNERLRAAFAKLADDILQRDGEYIPNGTNDDTWMSAEFSVAQDILSILAGSK